MSSTPSTPTVVVLLVAFLAVLLLFAMPTTAMESFGASLDGVPVTPATVKALDQAIISQVVNAFVTAANTYKNPNPKPKCEDLVSKAKTELTKNINSVTAGFDSDNRNRLVATMNRLFDTIAASVRGNEYCANSSISDVRKLQRDLGLLATRFGTGKTAK